MKSESNNVNLKKSKKRRLCISSSSSDLEKKTDKNRRIYEKIDNTWSEKYIKHFVCRICSSHWSNVATLKNHITNTHGALFKKYGSIFKSHCKVLLWKSDGKPNITGSSNKIMFDSEKIVENVNANYYIIYTTKKYKGDKYNVPHAEVRKNKTENKVISCFSSDSSDEEMVVKRKRKLRLDSRSSNETVVLDNNTNTLDDVESKNLEIGKVLAACINLDDSSDTESVKSSSLLETKRQNQLSKKKEHKLETCQENLRVLNEIITTCQNKYSKKQDKDAFKTKNPSDIASKLRHKIFSIGRKQINKSLVVNCTPLLRVMENKTLDILWFPRNIVEACQTSNFTRIFPRRKTTNEKSEDNEKGWIDISTSTNLVFSSKNNDPEQSNGQLNASKGIGTPENQCISDTAVISDANIMGSEIKKLLNANPVANPKQLPKKFAPNELKLVKLAPKPAENPPTAINNFDLCMPIITSTTSLAAPYVTLDNNDEPVRKSEVYSTTTDKQQSEAPRIKVKPVSELMSVETLNRMQSSEQNPMPIQVNILPKGQPLVVQNVTAPIMMATQDNVQLQSNDKITNLISPRVPPWQNEFMILDTVELPNTRTNTPYVYFKKLLQIHGITLLETHAALPDTFRCLVKFKVQYKQDVQHQPVVLCLALFCLNNVFCIKVKDRNNEDLDIAKISANWQWEVLKIYKGEVVNKLLSSAQTISREVYEYTNTFLCLLKSISVKHA